MNAPRGGYTLVELVVVLVILALAGALAVPAIAAWRPPSDIDTATARLVAVLHLARERAVSSGHASEMVIDAANRRAWLRPRDTSFVLDLPVGCQLAGGARSVMRFAPDGPSHGTLPSIACGDRRALVAADPLTGMPRVTAAP
jgi:prepilin-type N-terminal cleavage/methylation domain-containing protein